MKKVIVSSKTFTKKMVISIGAAGISLKDCEDGVEIPISACALVEDLDSESGDIKKIGAFIDMSGGLYSSISKNVIDVIPDICELIDSGEEVTIRLVKRVSRSGRDFLSILVI